MMTESVDKLGRLKYTNTQTDAWLEVIPTVSKMESLIDEDPERIGWVAVDFDVENSTENENSSSKNEVVEVRSKNMINDDDQTTLVVGYLDWVQTKNKLDFLYVHPKYARRQVATRLLQELLLTLQQQQQQQQKQRGSTILEEKATTTTIKTDASESSKPFFEKHGFHVLELQEFPIGGHDVMIHNYKMILRLT